METTCATCGKPLGSFETIHVAGAGMRCYSCFNRETAERMGVTFDNVQLQPIIVVDADGISHTFDIQSMLVATGHEMIAREITKGDDSGYRSNRARVPFLSEFLIR